jgi:O-antigen polymerase
VIVGLLIILPQMNNQDYILPTITTKFIYFIYGCLILAILYSLAQVFTKTAFFSFSKLDISLLALVFYIAVNHYFVQTQYGFSIRYMELLGLGFLYIVLRSISLKNYYLLLLSIVVSGIIQAVYGNLQLLGYYSSNHSGFKMTGSFFNPGPYTGFLVSVWAVALGMYLFKDSITMQVQSQKKNNYLFLNEVIKYVFEYIPLLGLISIAIVLPALQSRASWIAAIVGSAVLVELRYRFLSNLFNKVIAKLQKTALMLLAIGILSAGLFSIYHYKKASSDGRAFIWKVTTEMIADAPVFGVGFDLFKAHYMEYQAQYFDKNGETPEILVADNTYYAFNEGLQFVAENGLLGLLLLLLVGFVSNKNKRGASNQVLYIQNRTFDYWCFCLLFLSNANPAYQISYGVFTCYAIE